MKTSKSVKLPAALAVVTGLAAGAWAQTAYVPFIVNADAAVKAVQGTDSVSMRVTANIESILEIPLGGVSVSYFGAAGAMNAPAVTGSRGNITLLLPAQTGQSAGIALYSVNGKLVMRGKADASKAENAIMRQNLAAGAYLLSVKGADGNAFTARLTHSGGNLNIYAAFRNENASYGRTLANLFISPLGKQAAAGDWNITVSAVLTGYRDFTYTLAVNNGVNQLQNITLIPENGGGAGSTFTDSRDGKTYNKVKIGAQTWMARNLDYDVPDNTSDVCYNNRSDSCAKYGRLYNRETAKAACPAGWHLPSDAEWTALADFAGPAAGTKLKSASGWNNNGNGTDDYGFTALPGGDGYSNGSFKYAGAYGGWWCAAENDAAVVLHRNMDSGNDYVGRSERYPDGLFSVRCVED